MTKREPAAVVVKHDDNRHFVLIASNLVLALDGFTLRIHQLTQSLARDIAPMQKERRRAIADVIYQSSRTMATAARDMKRGGP